MRVLFWNIMAGGGKRADAIVAQIIRWQPDIISLAEYRGTAPSQHIAHRLHEYGFCHQLTTASPEHPARNALLLASHCGIDLAPIKKAPKPEHRWLLATVKTQQPFHIGVMHIPNFHTGFKQPYHNAVLSIAKRWKNGPAFLIGDTNSGLPDIDEENPAFGAHEVRFMNGMEDCKWCDVFRKLHGDQRAYTWYSPNGRNGFRLDQAFVNLHLIDKVEAFQYVWGNDDAHRQLSDHAAILLDLDG